MQGLARYVFQSGNSPEAAGPVTVSLVGVGSLQVYFDVCRVLLWVGNYVDLGRDCASVLMPSGFVAVCHN